MSGDAQCVERFLCALFATVVKPISDLRLLISGLLVLLLALSVSAQAQQARKMPVIGYLDYGAPIDRDEAFFEALRDLGWIEGQNIAIEYRWAEGGLDRLPSLW